MNSQVFIEGLCFETIIGVLEHERSTPQRVRVDVTLDTDISSAAETDELTDAVDYSVLAEAIELLAVSGRFLLVERLASEIAKRCLLDSRVNAATVQVGKPNALDKADAVGVRVYLSRADLNQ